MSLLTTGAREDDFKWGGGGGKITRKQGLRYAYLNQERKPHML